MKELTYATTQIYLTMVQVSKRELWGWRDADTRDSHFSVVLKNKKEDETNPTFYQYHFSEDGLIYFEDSVGKGWFLERNLPIDG